MLKFEEAHSLILLADKYNAKGLIRICKEMLFEILKRPPWDEHPSYYIVKAAILGYQLNDASLKEAAMKCMVESEYSLKDLQDWEALNKYPELMSEMFEYHSSAIIKKLLFGDKVFSGRSFR